MYRSQSVGDVLQQRMCIEYKWMDIQQSWSAYHGRYRKICWFRALFCAYRITCSIEIKNSAAILALVPALAHLAHARQHTHTHIHVRIVDHSPPMPSINVCLSQSSIAGIRLFNSVSSIVFASLPATTRTCLCVCVCSIVGCDCCIADIRPAHIQSRIRHWNRVGFILDQRHISTRTCSIHNTHT